MKNIAIIYGIEKPKNTHKINPLTNFTYFAKNIGAVPVVSFNISDKYVALAKEFKAHLCIVRRLIPASNKGANCLNTSKEITNPYFGNKMPVYGSVAGKTNE